MSDETADDLCRRLRDGDPTAPAEFCDTYLPLLLADRRWVPAGTRDEHAIMDAAIEAVLAFVQHPTRYNSQRLSLPAYLRMAAAGDLRNLLARERRHAGRRAPIESVELRPPLGNDAYEAPSLPAGVSRELLLRRLGEALPDRRDQQAVRLMLDGVRESDEYARIYGLTNLPMEDQRKRVKRHKDRLDKVMKRLGARFRDGG